jgi:hypothetical protein
MSYLADAHNDWHAVNGWNAGCPLDCAAADMSDGMDGWESVPAADAPAAEWEAYAAELFEGSEWVAREEARMTVDPWGVVGLPPF